jgi:hypothetical protein
MDVDHRATDRLDEIRSEDLHVAGKHDKIDLVA